MNGGPPVQCILCVDIPGWAKEACFVSDQSEYQAYIVNMHLGNIFCAPYASFQRNKRVLYGSRLSVVHFKWIQP